MDWLSGSPAAHMAEEDAEIDPVLPGAGGGDHDPEMGRLSNIITGFSKTWGGNFSDSRRVSGVLNRTPGAGAGGPAVPERPEELGAAEYPERAGLRLQAAGHLNVEVLDGSLQGLHRGRELPGMAGRGDVPGNMPTQDV